MKQHSFHEYTCLPLVLGHPFPYLPYLPYPSFHLPYGSESCSRSTKALGICHKRRKYSSEHLYYINISIIARTILYSTVLLFDCDVDAVCWLLCPPTTFPTSARKTDGVFYKKQTSVTTGIRALDLIVTC